MQADEARGRVVAAASLVIEIDEVLVATMASFSRARVDLPRRISSFSASFSVAASMTKSQSRSAP